MLNRTQKIVDHVLFAVAQIKMIPLAIYHISSLISFFRYREGALDYDYVADISLIYKKSRKLMDLLEAQNDENFT